MSRKPPHTNHKKTGIDERAFPYDAHGTEKPRYRAMAGLSAKCRGTQEKFLESSPPISRRKEAFHAYTFKRKTVNERPQSAPAYGTDLGGSLHPSGRRRGNNAQGQDEEDAPPPKPKMRPNSAHFLGAPPSSTKRRAVDLDVFPAPRSPRGSSSTDMAGTGRGSRHVFVHPTPPTDNRRLLTHHEKMFYTDHFAKLSVTMIENEKYKLDDAYNRESHYFDHKTTTLHAPSNEAVTHYRQGRQQHQQHQGGRAGHLPLRVVQHLKAGMQGGRSVSQKQNNGIARNALGGFYSK